MKKEWLKPTINKIFIKLATQGGSKSGTENQNCKNGKTFPPPGGCTP